MKSKNKLVFLKYYECPQVAIDFGTGKIQERPKYIDHNVLILTDFRGRSDYYECYIGRITFCDEKWYYSIEPRIECNQKSLISMANLARNHAIKHEDNVAEFYWFKAAYKVEDIYR